MTEEEKTVERARLNVIRDQEEQEYQRTLAELTPFEEKILASLQDFIDDLNISGVDVSYFPHSAQLELIRRAKIISRQVKESQ